MGLIYMRTSPSGGRYIGKTVGSEKQRWQHHISEAYDKNNKDYNSILNKAIRKYGGNNFSCEILEDNISNDTLNEREIYWIEYYKTFYLDNFHGYNMTKGGDSPIRINEKNFLNLWNEGKSITEISLITFSNIGTISKHLKNLGISADSIHERGIEKTKEKRRKVLQYSLNGNLINKFNSSAEAANVLEIDNSGISKACKNSSHKYKNYFWCYENDSINIENLTKQKNICRKIKCVEDSKVFNSAKAASEYYGVDHKTIINSCSSLKAIRKNNKHFIFYSEGENNE